MPAPKEVVRMTLDLPVEVARPLFKLAEQRGVGRRVIVQQALKHYFEYLKEQGRNGLEPEV